jgi:hypothetical protein
LYVFSSHLSIFGLKISPATIFNLTRRADDAVQSEYDAILNKIEPEQDSGFGKAGGPASAEPEPLTASFCPA